MILRPKGCYGDNGPDDEAEADHQRLPPVFRQTEGEPGGDEDQREGGHQADGGGGDSHGEGGEQIKGELPAPGR